MIRILIFIFFTTASFGQSKTRQVDESLGTRIREIPQPGETVEYVFHVGRKDQSYHRQGDGASEYTTLLQKTSGLSQFNDQGGTLLYIKKNGEVVARGSAVGSVSETDTRVKYSNEYTPSTTGDPVRPRSITLEPVEQPSGGMSFPDSMEMAQRLDGLALEIERGRGKFWATIQPIWAFVLRVLTPLIGLVICLIGIARYIAKTAANESLITSYGRVILGPFIVRAQQNAAVSTLVLSWILIGVILIDIFMWLVFLDLPIWLLILVWFPILWVAERLTDWVVPNANVVGDNFAVSPYKKQ